uniref:Uncharacterized protein n=1 Tax=Hyaloperonospora arabidopsidis (strain Emoy2) TaxID=559515 RepID=M4C0W7_HYAAE
MTTRVSKMRQALLVKPHLPEPRRNPWSLSCRTRMLRNLDSRESTSSEDVALEYPVPEHHLAYNDDKSDASSDIFVDAIEEQKLVEHTIQSWSFDKDDHSADESSDQTFGTTLSVDAFTVGDGAALLSPVNLEVFQEVDNKCLRSSICESDRRLSFHSEYSYREPSSDSQTARGSLASSSLSGAFRFNEEARDGSFRSRIDSYTDSTRSRIDSYADSTRSRIDSYADSTRSRGDSYADSVRFRTDSHADMFRSRGNSLDDEVRSRGDSYADVSTKSYHDEPSFTDEGNHDDGPKIFDTDSDRASSVISDSPGSDKNIREVEKDEVHDEAQATRTKSNSRWRAASVLSALSSRRSSKPTSSPASSFEEEEKDTKVPPATTLPSITGLSSVAGLLNRKLSVPMSKLSTTSEMEMEESSGVYSPQEQQPSKSKFRFGRFAAPTVSKATFPSRFTWKSTTRRGTNEYDDGEVVDSQTA